MPGILPAQPGNSYHLTLKSPAAIVFKIVLIITHEAKAIKMPMIVFHNIDLARVSWVSLPPAVSISTPPIKKAIAVAGSKRKRNPNWITLCTSWKAWQVVQAG